MVTTRRGGPRRRNPERAVRVSAASRAADQDDEEESNNDNTRTLNNSSSSRAQGAGRRQGTRTNGRGSRASTRAAQQRNYNMADTSRSNNDSRTLTTRRSSSRTTAAARNRATAIASSTEARAATSRSTLQQRPAITRGKRRKYKTLQKRSSRQTKKRPTVNIQTLIKQGDWDELKARVRRITNISRLGSVLNSCLSMICNNRNYYEETNCNSKNNANIDTASMIKVPHDELIKQLFTQIKKARDSKKYKVSRAIGIREGESRQQSTTALRGPINIRIVRNHNISNANSNSSDDDDDSNDEEETSSSDSLNSMDDLSEDSSLFSDSDDSSDYSVSFESTEDDNDDDDDDNFSFHFKLKPGEKYKAGFAHHNFELKFAHDVLNRYTFKFDQFCYGAPNSHIIQVILSELEIHFNIQPTSNDCERTLVKIWTKYISDRGVSSFENISNIAEMKERNPHLASMCDKTRFLWQQSVLYQRRKDGNNAKTKSQVSTLATEAAAAASSSVASAKESADVGRSLAEEENSEKQVEASNNSDSIVVLSKMIENDYPPVLLWFWMNMYPAEAKMRDDTGRLPIHYCIFYDLIDDTFKDVNDAEHSYNRLSSSEDDSDDDEVNDSNSERDSYVWSETWQEFNDKSSDLLVTLASDFMAAHENDLWSSRVDFGGGFSINTLIMRQLLSYYPEAMTVPDPRTSKLPLVALLQTGMTTQEKTIKKERDKEFLDLACTLPLLRSYGPPSSTPDVDYDTSHRGNESEGGKDGSGDVGNVLNRIDPETRMYPFMMVEHADIDLAYTLLRENPSVLQQFIRETNYEQHLKRRVSSLERTISDLQAQVKTLKEQLAAQHVTNIQNTDGNEKVQSRKRIRL